MRLFAHGLNWQRDDLFSDRFGYLPKRKQGELTRIADAYFGRDREVVLQWSLSPGETPFEPP